MSLSGLNFRVLYSARSLTRNSTASDFDVIDNSVMSISGGEGDSLKKARSASYRRGKHSTSSLTLSSTQVIQSEKVHSVPTGRTRSSRVATIVEHEDEPLRGRRKTRKPTDSTLQPAAVMDLGPGVIQVHEVITVRRPSDEHGDARATTPQFVDLHHQAPSSSESEDGTGIDRRPVDGKTPETSWGNLVPPVEPEDLNAMPTPLPHPDSHRSSSAKPHKVIKVRKALPDFYVFSLSEKLRKPRSLTSIQAVRRVTLVYSFLKEVTKSRFWFVFKLRRYCKAIRRIQLFARNWLEARNAVFEKIFVRFHVKTQKMEQEARKLAARRGSPVRAGDLTTVLQRMHPDEVVRGAIMELYLEVRERNKFEQQNSQTSVFLLGNVISDADVAARAAVIEDRQMMAAVRRRTQTVTGVDNSSNFQLQPSVALDATNNGMDLATFVAWGGKDASGSATW
eukprot:PhF_6_TR37542/c0_g1_i4/m.55603